uniref:Uncharacterized protein n=1 Tax=Parastrongyloides trichosuri TaxID=131310 RepID=A0A0N5A2A2_PARTI
MRRIKGGSLSLSARSGIKRKIQKVSTISAPSFKRGEERSLSARSWVDNQNDLVSLISAASLSRTPSIIAPLRKPTINGNIYKKRTLSNISFTNFQPRHSIM